MNFWNKLKKPIFCLAPMADVTDRAFRRVIAKYSKIPRTVLGKFEYVTYTEFVSADGLWGGGYDALINDLSFSSKERPIIAQFFTSKPEMIKRAAELAVRLGFDGVDINMGCPDRSVEKQGAGAKLIKNPKLARELISAAKEGVRIGAKKYRKKTSEAEIPVSVKTRIGYSKNDIETWIPELLAAKPALITIHARTRKELSLVPAKWDCIKRAVEIRNEMQNGVRGGSRTLIIGNGDVSSIEDGLRKVKETGCDGVMVGRGVFGNPWFFADLAFEKNGIKRKHIGEKLNKNEIKKKLKVMVEHVKLFEKLVMPKPPKGQGKSFAVMKKHFKAYVSGWNGAKELRMKLMEAENAKEVSDAVRNFLKLSNARRPEEARPSILKLREQSKSRQSR